MPSFLLRRATRLSGKHTKSNIVRWRFCYLCLKSFVTLAIETSCDDTSVAVAELLPASESPRFKVHFHEKVTANSDAYAGIHPLVALESHQVNLATLLRKAIEVSPHPDLVAATRGPGMRSNLSVGLNTAKGLACAWKLPFIGVHHMQAHALTPRLVSIMAQSKLNDAGIQPDFPFLTVLVSGGHTLLINSMSLTTHTILAETQDIALGDCLDKAARAILPHELIKAPYGKALEDFAFPRGSSDYDYTPPTRRREELESRRTVWGWSLGPPLAESGGGSKSTRRMIYSFAGLLTNVQRLMRESANARIDLPTPLRSSTGICSNERREIAREIQRVAFEHLASRILLYLSTNELPDISTIVVSGGVAANSYLQHVLRRMLDVRGYKHMDLAFPPTNLCTDNALMIAWAATEMFLAGYQSSLDIAPLRKWSMDPSSADRGILGVQGWQMNPMRTPAHL